ncbi:hypothetical protein BpHYR1_006751 [Brachionus plicatilis]|uniref:Uncharacterized protein n=1 Tax=Brachionus plicatilis TaxID=10195 RepID=A0A3M7RKU1_BRAPC|nr:hypothetical protein BpHYR1_006751 [Brachionus plicatilis]
MINEVKKRGLVKLMTSGKNSYDQDDISVGADDFETNLNYHVKRLSELDLTNFKCFSSNLTIDQPSQNYQEMNILEFKQLDICLNKNFLSKKWHKILVEFAIRVDKTFANFFQNLKSGLS